MAEELDFTGCVGHVAEFLGLEPKKLTRSTHIYNDLGIDSLGMFSLGMHLIHRYGIRLPLSEVSAIVTIGDLYDALHKYRRSAE